MRFWESSHGKTHVGPRQRWMLCDSRWAIPLIDMGQQVAVADTWVCDVCWRRGRVRRIEGANPMWAVGAEEAE